MQKPLQTVNYKEHRQVDMNKEFTEKQINTEKISISFTFNVNAN